MGAISGLFFEIGIGRLGLPPVALQNLKPVEIPKSALQKISAQRAKERETQDKAEQNHTRLQYELIKLGGALGYKPWVARNDRSKQWNDERFSFITTATLPQIMSRDVDRQTIELIDVLWLDRDKIVCAFER